MKKKLLFHILICALLFTAITVPYGILSSGDDIPYSEVTFSSSSEPAITENGDVIFIGDKLEILYAPDFVSPGDDTRIEILGPPNTLYDINVYYPSGISQAKAFTDKYSLDDGKVCWEFTVSSRTTADKLRVVIRSETAYLSFYIPVTNL